MENNFKYPRVIQSSRMRDVAAMLPRGHSKCPQCGNVYRTSNLKRHIQTHADERPHKCDQCPRAFKQPTELESHKSTHINEKFCCQQCGEEFKTRQVYMQHLETHTDNVSCDHCDYKCATLNLLHQHKITHLNTEQLMCDYKATSNVLFSSHMKQHKKKKIVVKEKCPLCDFEAYSKNTFRRHFKQHNLDNFEKCVLCGYHPPDDYLLRKHLIKVHGGVRNVKCGYCEVMFLTQMEMRGHRKLVHKGKDYQCEKCLKYYSRYSSLYHHRKTCKEKLITIEFNDIESDPLALESKTMNAVKMEESSEHEKFEEVIIKEEHHDEELV